MNSLFAEAFLVAPVKPRSAPPEAHYDEIRQMNVTASGDPLVAVSGAQGPETLTEVRGEAEEGDERYEDHIAAIGSTVTKVQLERDDFAAQLFAGGTTHTAVDAEPDDEDRAARAELDTFALLTASTDTRVKNERNDFWADREEFPIVIGSHSD